MRHTFPQGHIVRGVATLDSELFVLRMPANSQIEVFSVDDYSLQRRLSVPHLRDAVDMASCPRHRCLYVAGQFVRLFAWLESGHGLEGSGQSPRIRSSPQTSLWISGGAMNLEWGRRTSPPLSPALLFFLSSPLISLPFSPLLPLRIRPLKSS